MAWHLFAVLIMAVCGGGLAFGLRKLTRGRVPKWLIPASAAACMLGYLAYYDYDWYGFKRSQLPEGSSVIRESRQSSFFRPWSYLRPSVSAFTILDGKFAAKVQDGQRLIEYFEYTFRKDPIEGLDTQAFVLNCHTGERVPFDPASGKVTGATEAVAMSELIYRQACP
ncbi:MAG: hypothetical protein Q4G70_15510 [Pseudomonadota bacterium]|nr:hypothetical protein [Pseudomonadota bacterium]